MNEIDRPAVDAWSGVHLGAGAILGQTNLSRPMAYGAIALYEAVEPHVWPGYRESPRNVGMDFLVGVLGYEISRYLKRTR